MGWDGSVVEYKKNLKIDPGTGYESGAGCEITSGTYAIELISWAASEGSTVSSLICDRWLICKLATFISP